MFFHWNSQVSLVALGKNDTVKISQFYIDVQIV